MTDRTLAMMSTEPRRGVTDRLMMIRGGPIFPDTAILQVTSSARGEPTEVGQIILTRELAADLRDALSLWLTERDASE